jgi:hypothetical protein
MFNRKSDYDPIVKAFMLRSAKHLRKGARSNDPALMWAILFNLKGVIASYEDAAEESLLVAKLGHDIDTHNAKAK